jgi:large subunit ribosomal protein L5
VCDVRRGGRDQIVRFTAGGRSPAYRIEDGTAMKARLEEAYEREVMAELMKQFGYKNKMDVPRLQKIVVNMGTGDALQNAKLQEAAEHDLAVITGQKAAVRRATKSVASFKIREGMVVGCCVTLRRKRMYEFYDRLVNSAIPRIRDFRGVPLKSFDGRGNYTLGIREQIVFPEIDIDKVEKIRGMNITIVTTAKTDEEAVALLQAMGMPFRRT